MNISKANLCSTLHLINENEHGCKLGTIANILKAVPLFMRKIKKGSLTKVNERLFGYKSQCYS